ncbi:MAG: hypothetical protein AAF392_00310 [Bacteroidota bacterium]
MIKSLSPYTLPQAPVADTVATLGFQLLDPYALVLEPAGVIFTYCAGRHFLC